MTRLGLAALFSFLGASAFAAALEPAAQTLEAMHGASISDPDRFFDGLASRVHLVEPVAYAPLPEPPPAPVVQFDSRRVAPGVTLHTPLPAPESVPASAAALEPKAEGGPPIWGLIAAGILAVGLILLLVL